MGRRTGFRESVRSRIHLVAGVALLVTGATSGCTVLPWYRVPDRAFARGTVVVECCVHGEEPVELTYLGVGGWLVRSGESALLTAPLYSNPGLVETGLTAIAADPDAIDRHLPDVSEVAAVLVGHGHYDHLMDVPWVLAHRAPRALLYANRTSWLQVEPFGLERRALVESGVSRPITCSAPANAARTTEARANCSKSTATSGRSRRVRTTRRSPPRFGRPPTF